MNNQELIDLLTRETSTAVDQNLNENVSDKLIPQNESEGEVLQSQVEKLVEQDLNVIRALMGAGVIDREQGHNLMKQVIKNAHTNVTTKKHEEITSELKTQSLPQKDVFEEFSTLNPDFFNQTGREDLLTYLKNSPLNFDKEELLQISKLVEKLEQNAVERYLKKEEWGKTLNDENNIAKQRLTANAQNSAAADNNRVFTRTQIGKMSGDEFAKYETMIMDQLRKGLIK